MIFVDIFLITIGLFVIIRKQWTVWAIFFTSTIAQRSSVATQYFSATSVLGTRISFLGKINFSSSGNSRIFNIFVFNLIYILRILSSKTSQTFRIRSWRTDTSRILLTFHVSLTARSVLLNEFSFGLHYIVPCSPSSGYVWRVSLKLWLCSFRHCLVTYKTLTWSRSAIRRHSGTFTAPVTRCIGLGLHMLFFLLRWVRI